jgi:HlyD family secretion protein
VVGADQLVESRSGMAFFRVDIVAPAEAFAAFDAQKIRPGLPVEAFITTEQQTVMSYLFKPLFDQFARAFRES